MTRKAYIALGDRLTQAAEPVSRARWWVLLNDWLAAVARRLGIRG